MFKKLLGPGGWLSRGFSWNGRWEKGLVWNERWEKSFAWNGRWKKDLVWNGRWEKGFAPFSLLVLHPSECNDKSQDGVPELPNC